MANYNYPDYQQINQESASPEEFRYKCLEIFRDHLNLIGSESITEEDLADLYKSEVVIVFNRHVLSLPFDAVTYNGLLSLVENAIKEF